MFTIFFTNMGYARDEQYASLELAVEASRQFGFQTTILQDGKTVACWCPLAGLRRL